mmetsp:Transcript_16764/g.16195  ORF Transcript_16764/g.16195 Transcript_16764/m.16195 type:complete len:115 (-) Transcript_16764:44-388(-)
MELLQIQMINDTQGRVHERKEKAMNRKQLTNVITAISKGYIKSQERILEKMYIRKQSTRSNVKTTQDVFCFHEEDISLSSDSNSSNRDKMARDITPANMSDDRNHDGKRKCYGD